MILDYFKNIDTKEKAYWLGFLYADGCVNIDKRKDAKRLIIGLSIKDEEMINRFLKTIDSDTKKRLKDSTIEVTIGSNQICNDLIKYGCVPRKSKIVEIPKLDSRYLYLAFLLGYFDGNGQQKTTVIYSGSVKFLEQLKSMFGLTYKILSVFSDSRINGREVHGESYRMNLGAEMFNEMMDNYSDSMPRKRLYFCTKEEKRRRSEKASMNNNRKKKLVITREELERLVWEMPSERVAEKYGVSGKLIGKRCKQLGIEKPGRGYWAKNRRLM